MLILSLWVLSTASFPTPLAVGEDPKGKISFQPNVIPDLEISFVEEFFRFEWRDNRFDLKLSINCMGKNHSLRDFWELTDRLVSWEMLREKATESMYEFGYMISDIPEEIANDVEFLVWKIEGASFDTSENSTEIELEEIDTFFELGYNITNIRLPDNLMLSYKDLQLYNFTVSHPFKTETIVKGEGLKKSNWNLDPITFSSPVITVVGTYTNLFWDVWNASNTNGWNQVNNTCNTQFKFWCRLQIGDGSTATACSDTNKQVVFDANATVANFEDIILVMSQASLTLGTLINDSDKTVKDGCEIRYNDATHVADIVGQYGAMYFYGTSFSSTTDSMLRVWLRSDGKLYHVTGKNLWKIVLNDADIVAYHVTTIRWGYLSMATAPTTAPEYIYGYGGFHNVEILGGTTLRNFVGRASIGSMFRNPIAASDAYVIDADVDVWTFSMTGGPTGEVYRQYTFDLTVTTAANGPIEDANVTLTYYGQGGGTHGTWLTDANGEIPEQTVTAGFYNQTGGNTIYSYNPYEITITKAGYLTYQRNFTQLEAKSWNIALLTETGYNWFAATIIIGIFACFMTIYALTGKN